MSDSEATRAAGMTSEQKVKAVDPDAYAGTDGSVWAIWADPTEKAPTQLSGEHPTQKEAWDDAASRIEHRPVRENLDLMRDATDAMSGEKPKCGISRDGDFCRLEASGQCPQESNNRALRQDVCPLYVEEDDEEIRETPKPVAPASGKDAFEAWLDGFRFRYQNGMEFTPVEKDIARHAWNGRAALESNPAPDGEVKVTWRVEQRVGKFPDYEWVRVIEDNSEDVFVPYAHREYTFRLVKIETRETVVETRKRGA